MSLKVLMVFPRFNENSFWSLRAACKIYGAQCPAPPLGLITLAALLPQEWDMRLVDRNAQTLKPADLAWADVVMTGGMLPQRVDTLEVIRLCKEAGRTVVVGGPDPTSCEEIYEAADFLVLGEAEGIINEFVAAWNRGERKGKLRAEKFTADVTTSPVPRFDLISPGNYLYVGVQFSRGCPFNCEFCDIIELYGRVPRSKTNEQMLAELQALYDTGHRGHVDFVDDNLIGNKKALKRFLPVLEQWQAERGFPFMFSTEASINLSDDTQLLQMLARANFFAIFVGIESPDTDTLISTRKKQNTRRSLAESVHKIYAAGIFVIAGFIVGFDTEKGGVAEGMIDCIEATSIPACMVGLLTALPNTQLFRRLDKEQRLLPFQSDFSGDQCTAGINFIPKRPRREILADYREILASVYAPDAYFDRVRTVALALRRPTLGDGAPKKIGWREAVALMKIMVQMNILRPHLRRPFWRTVTEVAKKNPAALEACLIQMVLYLHLGPFAQFVQRDLDRQIAELENEPEQIFVPPAAAIAAQ